MESPAPPSNGGAKKNIEDSKGHTQLHSAAQDGSLAEVKRLLENGADPNAQDADGRTPLHLAAEYGWSDCVEVLLAHGVANVNDTGVRAGQTPLHAAAAKDRQAVVGILLERGADANARNTNWITPLHVAAKSGCSGCVKLLMKHGANVNAKDEDDNTALHLAVDEDHQTVVRDLLEHGAELNARNTYGKTPLHAAVYSVKLLLAHWASVNAEYTHMCIRHGETPLLTAAKSGELACLKLLLDHGADPSATDNGGLTPLHAAANRGYLDCAKALLDSGANARATPLHDAVAHSHSAVVRLLLERGAELNARNTYGQTLLHMALDVYASTYTSHILELHDIIERIEGTEERTGKTPDFLLFLARRCHQMNCSNFSSFDVITELFSRGVDVNAKNQEGQTPSEFVMRSDKFACNEFMRLLVASLMRKLNALAAARIAEKNMPLFLEFMNPSEDSSPDNLFQYVDRKLDKQSIYQPHGYDNCVRELENLRAILISPYITAADVLTLRDPVALARISLSRDFRKFAQSQRLDSNFPIYSRLIKLQHQRARDSMFLCEKSEVSLGIASSGRLNKDCVYEILQYLSEAELRNLSEATNNVSID